MVMNGKQLWLWLWGCVCLIAAVQAFPALEFKYHNYSELTKYLHDVATAYPNMTKLYSIGTSLRQLKLWVLEVSTAPKSQLGVPNVKLIGNIHGNEPAGREVLLHLIQFLVTNYTSDDTVRWLLNNTRVHILPSLNPDGFEISTEGKCEFGKGRENARRIDLNRSFPDHFQTNSVPQQPETRAIMDWLHNNSFVLSASLHGGALVANYPFENVKETSAAMLGDTFPPSISPDDDVFKHLAMIYASTHPTMHRGESCNGKEPGFPDGITNGAAWYPLTGGMQDYNYVYHGCMEITLEISCCKYPYSDELPDLWNDNKNALLKYMAEVHTGVKGLVWDKTTSEPIKNATLNIVGRDIKFWTSPKGEFWRILMPGTYQLQVQAPNYIPQTVTFTVRKRQTQTPTWLNITMSTVDSQTTVTEEQTLLTNSTDDDINTSTVSDSTVELTPSSNLVTDITSPSMAALEIYNSQLKESQYEEIEATRSCSAKWPDPWFLVAFVVVCYCMGVWTA